VNVHSGNASQFGVNGAYYGVWYRLGIGGFVGSNNVDQYNNDAWENRITDSYNLDSTWNYSGWVKYYMGNGNFSNWFFMTSGAGFNFRWCNWVNYDFTNATDECYQQWPNPPNYTGPDPVMSYAEAPVGGLTPVTRLSAGQMGNQVNYNNWNFSTIWQMGPNGYPTLRNILDPQ
jgi:hypothetical protein